MWCEMCVVRCEVCGVRFVVRCVVRCEVCVVRCVV